MSKQRKVYSKAKIIYGVAYNDSDQPVTCLVDGKRVKCKIYEAWSNMLARCYSKAYQSGKPTYEGASVCQEWLLFSKFKLWMQAQDWQGKQLDKDYLVEGNKIYSPETCIFLPQLVNSFISSTISKRKNLACGVFLKASTNKFYAKCSDPFAGKSVNLGTFLSEEDAGSAWKQKKREFAHRLADAQTDKRVSALLRSRYE
jgi:hypothetical protein